MQTLIHNLTIGFTVKHKGAATCCTVPGRDAAEPSCTMASVETFLQDPDCMKVELMPVVDEASNTQQIISVQVGLQY